MTEPAIETTKEFKKKTWIALALMVTAALLEWTWVYAVLFFLWALNDIIQGEAHFVEKIIRKNNPVTFWCIQLLWIYFGIWFLQVQFIGVSI